MDFLEHYILTEEPGPQSDTSDWRQRMVWHRTKTGQRNKVKVKSLPPEEQWKYAPLEVKLKRKKQGREFVKEPKGPQEEKRVFTVYFSADRKGGVDEFEEGKLVVATDDSAKAIDIEKAGHKVGVAHAVPLEAFKKFYSYETGEWKPFPKDLDDEKKYELISFTDNDLYLVDMFTYKDSIETGLSDEAEETEDEE